MQTTLEKPVVLRNEKERIRIERIGENNFILQTRSHEYEVDSKLLKKLIAQYKPRQAL